MQPISSTKYLPSLNAISKVKPRAGDQMSIFYRNRGLFRPQHKMIEH